MSGNNKNKNDEKKIDFLIEAYRLRVQLFNNHTGRMWTRFNYLLVLALPYLAFLLPLGLVILLTVD